MSIKVLSRVAVMVSMLFSAALAYAASDVVIPTQKLNQALHDRLPDQIKQSREIIAANFGTVPPYVIELDSKQLEGSSIDFSNAVGEILGVSFNHQRAAGFSGVLMGIKSERYHISFGPIGDFPSRRDSIEFIDFVKEYVVFAVKKGNPQYINSLDDICGKRIAVVAGGMAEKVINQQSELCVKTNQAAVIVQSFQEQYALPVALNSDRTDAIFTSQAYLAYFVTQDSEQLELAGIGQKNGFDDLFQGAIVAKDSTLGPIILAAFQELFDNGTYALIMQKWGLENNMLSAPGINLAK